MEPENLKLILYWTGLAFFLLLELKFSYRRPTVSKFRRILTNIPLSIANGLLYHLFYFSILSGLFITIESQQLGLLNSMAMPAWLKIFFAILLLDFTIYMWHLVNHEVPLFWRFHRVHHSDLNMDTTTSNRFHAGEILMSGLVRLTVIYAFGIPLTAYLLFEVLVNLSIQFHHSSIRMPSAFERLWIFLFVPPSMHRVHHSVKILERDSNYGVILSLWDRIFGTLTTDTNQENIIIGLGSHRDFKRLNFLSLWAMPFTRSSR